MKNNSLRLLMSLAGVLIVLSLVLAACAPIDDNGGGHGKDDEDGAKPEKGKNEKITICHKTDNAEKPYVEITLPQHAAEKSHSKHEGDIIPAPEDGCPVP